MSFHPRNVSRVELVTVRYREVGDSIDEMMAPGYFPVTSGFLVGENLLIEGSDGRAFVWVSGITDSREDPKLVIDFIRTSRRPGRKPGPADQE